MRIRSAIPDDAQEILNMIIELADYEKSAHEVTATAEDIHKSFFTAKPSVYCEIVEDLGDNDNTVIVGLAVWFLNYSTWQGKHGIYLEDLYIRPKYRGKGYGKSLLQHLAAKCIANGYGRFQWWVLDWNSPSIEFYRSVGAKSMDEWTVFRVDGEALNALATSPTPATNNNQH